MSLVTLASGGLDSSLVAVLARENGIEQFPLFIDYGQICRDQELEACIRVFSRLGLPKPEVMDRPVSANSYRLVSRIAV